MDSRRIGAICLFLELGLYGVSAPGALALVAPSELTAAAVSETEIDLSWTDNSKHESAFAIERSLDAAEGFIRIAKIRANRRRLRDTALSVATRYHYRVMGLRSGHAASECTNVASALTPGADMRGALVTERPGSERRRPIRIKPLGPTR